MAKRILRIGHSGEEPVVCFAVEELQRYLQMMDPTLSVDIVITPPSLYNGIIWVGVAPEFCLPVENPEEDDSIAVEIKGDAGIIAGSNSRSVLIAAYRFLKELGCDWVRPGKAGERIPQKTVGNISACIRENARFRYRGVCIEGANSYENVADMLDFLPKVGLNSYFIQFLTPVSFFKRWYGHKSNPYYEAGHIDRETVENMTVGLEEEIARRGLMYHKTGHGWTCEPLGLDGTGWNSDKSKDYGLSDETRACLAMVNGKRELFGNDPLNTNLCYSNPKVRRRMVEAAVEYCKKHRNIDILHFWLADGNNNQCECEACKEKRPSDWYVMLLNELDQALTVAGLDTKIAFLLYMDLLWVPVEMELQNHNRFILMFAPITRKYGESYGAHLAEKANVMPYSRNALQMPASLGENLAYLRNWQKLFCGDGFVYDYHLMWAHLNDPGYEHVAKNLFDDINCLEKLGLKGMISCQVQRCFFPSALPMQMMAAALWDENCNYEEKAEAYYLSAFGPHGLTARKYLMEVSEHFSLYEGASHGSGAKMEGPLCCGYEKLKQCVREMRQMIDKCATEESPWREEWRLLRYHSEYVQFLAEAAELTDKKDYEKARAVLTEMVDWLNGNEYSLQPVMDCFNAKKHWLRRLDPEKFRKSMDV